MINGCLGTVFKRHAATCAFLIVAWRFKQPLSFELPSWADGMGNADEKPLGRKADCVDRVYDGAV